MGRKKPFIEKNEGIKFYLVHRSQKDPMFLDESLGEHVLVPADPDTNQKLVEAVNGLQISGTKRTETEIEETKRKRLEEQQKFGIYFDDNYNYLQHLKEVDHEEDIAELDKPDMLRVGSVMIKNERGQQDEPHVDAEKKKLQLPSSVFASKFEEDVGYFNQAAPDHDPKIHWDPDIVKILDEDPDIDFEDADNLLDDDFFVKANCEPKPAPKFNKSVDEDDDEDDDEDEDEYGSDEAEQDYDNDSESKSVREFETKSKFSNYSMSSSVIRRNEKLRYLDDHFENIYSQYDEDQIGALDMEEIDGYRGNDSVLESALEEFDNMIKKRVYEPPVNTRPKLSVLKEESTGEGSDEEDETTDTEDSDDKTECGSEDETERDDEAKKNYELVRLTKKRDKEDRFDCESIISTYSTLYNHPAVIKETSEKREILLSKKTGLPLGVLTDKPKSKKEMDRIDHKITRILPEVPDRKPDETKEEKKARKQLVKEHRRERRVEKKINKLAFKEEEARQVSQMANKHNMVKLPL